MILRFSIIFKAQNIRLFEICIESMSMPLDFSRQTTCPLYHLPFFPNQLVNAAVLKLGGRDPFQGCEMFLKGRQSLPGLSYYFKFVVVCNTLGSQKFSKSLERVAIQKSQRTSGLMVRVRIADNGSQKNRRHRKKLFIGQNSRQS